MPDLVDLRTADDAAALWLLALCPRRDTKFAKDPENRLVANIEHPPDLGERLVLFPVEAM